MATPIEAIKFPIAVDAGFSQLAQEPDYEKYVSQLVRQVLLTAPGERVDRPDFGAGLRRMVFQPLSEATASLLETTVFQSLDRWLGTLIDVNDVSATASDGRLDVTIVYTLKARGTEVTLNLEVTV